MLILVQVIWLQRCPLLKIEVTNWLNGSEKYNIEMGGGDTVVESVTSCDHVDAKSR